MTAKPRRLSILQCCLVLFGLISMAGCGAGIATVDQQTTGNSSGGSGTATIGGTGDSAPPPSVTNVSPNSGPASGGTMITISGSNFHLQAQVLVGGLPPASFTVQNSSSIVATTAAHAAGSVEVQVTNPDMQRGILLNAFTYDPIPAPFITTVSPNGGPSSGGTQITINGGNFVSGATVLVGGSPATAVTLLSSTQLTAVTPGGFGTVDVQVRNPDGQIATLAGTFNYTLAAPPNIQSVSPNSGPASGGTQITITGADFVSGASVVVGGVAATGVNFVSATEITAITPAHAPGVVGVLVRNPDNQTDTAANAFTYAAPPSISSIAPSSGPAAGGTPVTITGANFRVGATVRFGAIASGSVTINSSNQIQAISPPSAPGTVSVSVINTDGQSGILNSAFSYTGLVPAISSISPVSGPLAGGTTVVITGTNFATGAAVSFGGAPAISVTVTSSTQIQTVSPAGAAAGAVDVRVTNPDLSVAIRSNGFTYVPAPLVQSIAPNSGTTAGGTFVTISGMNFQPGALVLFGATAATNVVVTSGTTIIANTPAGAAGAVNVSVRNPDQQVGILNNGFTYAAIPGIVSINPTSGPAAGGTPVTITGASFVNGATVRFGATAAASVTFNSATSLTAVTPAGAGLVDVTVTNPGGQAATLFSAFSYNPGLAPTIVSVVPNAGPATGGTLVAVNGANFQAGATVSFAGTPATNVTVLSSSQIRAVTPAGTAGSVAVQVTNPDTQNVTLFNGFTYVPPPTVASVNPGVGFAAGGTIVSVLGSNFQSGATVFFGGVAASAVSFVNAGQLSVTTPAHAPGAVSVQVTNPDGQSSTLANGFTYQQNPAPTVVSVSPSSAPASGTSPSGPTQVTVMGSNFLPGAAVLFGGTAGIVTGVTGTQIGVQAPAHLPGTVDVEVRNPDGQSAILANSFTFVAGPAITSVAPNTGPTAGGTTVVVNGSGFVAGALVLFGGVSGSSAMVLGPTQIQAVTPAGPAGSVQVRVVNPDMQVGILNNGFTYTVTLPAPTITTVSPTTGPDNGGTAVTVSGTNFQTSATVSFGGAAASVGSITSSQISAATAPHAAGQVDVVVSNPDGQSATLANGYSYLPTALPGVRRPTPPALPAPVDPAIIPPPDTTGYATLTVCGAGCMFSSVQAAVNAASCNPNGSIIALRAGETFNITAKIQLPTKNCAPGKWIVIRTDTPDSNLPPPGTRVDPAVHAAVMPRIQNSTVNEGGFFVQPGARRYRFVGLEVTVTSTASGNSAELIEIGDGSFSAAQDAITEVPMEIVVDRCYLHGNATTAAPRSGVAVHCGQCAVVDSYIAEIHNVGFDTAAIRGWNGTGPILIRNNFLAGAGVNIFFGGADTAIPNNIPSDITIERNHIFKPLTWRIGDPAYLGVPWQVKASIELKMGKRVLMEGNVIENNWQHAQAGSALNFKSENQSGRNPWIQTADLTVRYNRFIRIQGGPIEIGGSAGIFPDVNLARVAIHDNLFDEQGSTNGGRYVLVAAGDVTAWSFSHNTVVVAGPRPSSFITMAFDNDVPLGQIPYPGGAAVHDNIFGTSSSSSNAAGVNENCAIGGVERPWQCFDSPPGTPNGEDSWHRNLVYHTNPTNLWCTSTRPFSSNSPWARNKAACVNTINEVGFIDVASKNYRLAPGSPGKGRATDAPRDVGADIDMVESKTAGVK